MNLKTLALVVCCIAMPVLAYAQDSTSTGMSGSGMRNDSTMGANRGTRGTRTGGARGRRARGTMRDSTGTNSTTGTSMGNDSTMGRAATGGNRGARAGGNRGRRVRGTRRSAAAVAATGDTMARGQMSTSSDGVGCARGCPTSRGAAGLTGVQFLALQQELRDRGCGNAHVTGVLDGPTRAAIRTCAKRLNVANSASAVLDAFNIGFSAGTNTTTPGATGSGDMSMSSGNTGASASSNANAGRTGRRGRAGRRGRGTGTGTGNDSTMSSSVTTGDTATTNSGVDKGLNAQSKPPAATKKKKY